mmetsp:Transcript_86200/g.180327  ORF Transcript_86200/g.180327 Transcript_86200/m.180327 type:complete len:385 (+) Transcript_86200:116-1270(+)
MGRLTVNNAGADRQVNIPDDAYQALLRLKHSGEPEQEVLRRAVDWFCTYSLITKDGALPDLKLSIPECKKASLVMRQMAMGGYKEETRVVTCRALFGDQDSESLQEAFDSFDREGDGVLSKEELRRALPLMGEDITDEKVDELFKIIDADKSDKIDFAEFCTLITSLNPKGGASIFESLQGLGTGLVETTGGLTGGLTSGFSELGSGVSCISAAYSAGLSDLGARELRKAGVILQNFKAAGYSEETAVATARGVLGEQTDESLKEAFKLFDANSSGYIDTEEMKKALPLMGEHIPDDKLTELYNICDKNGNGKIEFEEFASLVRKLNPKDAPGASQEAEQASSSWLQLPSWLGGGGGGGGGAEEEAKEELPAATPSADPPASSS